MPGCSRGRVVQSAMLSAMRLVQVALVVLAAEGLEGAAPVCGLVDGRAGEAEVAGVGQAGHQEVAQVAAGGAVYHFKSIGCHVNSPLKLTLNHNWFYTFQE